MSATLAWNVGCILLMMVPGYVLRRRGILSEAATGELARLSVVIIYPCLMFAAITDRYDLASLVVSWTLPAGVLGIMVAGYAAGMAVVRFLTFPSPDQRRSFLFQCAFNNYCFLPLPLVLALWGPDAAAMLLFSSLGAEVAVWTLGMFILSGRRLHWEQARHLLSPPLLAMAAAVGVVAVRDLGLLPAWADQFRQSVGGRAVFHTIQLTGQATIPLAMTIAGSGLAMLPLAELRNRRVWLVSALRLLAIPALLLLALHWIPFSSDQIRHVLAVVAVMPAAVASISLGKVYGGDEHFTAGSVLLTHLGALVSVPLLLALALH